MIFSSSLAQMLCLQLRKVLTRLLNCYSREIGRKKNRNSRCLALEILSYRGFLLRCAWDMMFLEVLNKCSIEQKKAHWSVMKKRIPRSGSTNTWFINFTKRQKCTFSVLLLFIWLGLWWQLWSCSFLIMGSRLCSTWCQRVCSPWFWIIQTSAKEALMNIYSNTMRMLCSNLRWQQRLELPERKKRKIIDTFA